MSIEESLRLLIIDKYGSMLNFSKEMNMANSTLATIMKNGVHKASVSNIIKICQKLEISADELAQDRIVPISKDDPIQEYAKKLSLLSPEDRENVFKYIDFLGRDKGEES